MFVLGQILQIEKVYLIVIIQYHSSIQKNVFSELKEPDGECLGFTD